MQWLNTQKVQTRNKLKSEYRFKTFLRNTSSFTVRIMSFIQINGSQKASGVSKSKKQTKFKPFSLLKSHW